MNNQNNTSLTCPCCGQSSLSIMDSDSIMVLSPELALFSVECHHCHNKIKTLRPIPAELQEEIDTAAHEINAGMMKI